MSKTAAVKNIFRKIKNTGLRTRYSHQAWFRGLLRSQQEIVAHNTHPYYVVEYQWAETSYWFNIPKWLSELRKTLPASAALLDVGCAYGTLALYARNELDFEVYCTDIADSFLTPELRATHGIHFALNNIEREPLPWSRQFDVILLTEVLEHFNFKPVPTLIKLREQLTPCGRLFLSTPDAQEWGRITRYYPHLDAIPDLDVNFPLIDDHVWQYNQTELMDVLKQSGFQVEYLAYSPGQIGRHFNLQMKKLTNFG